MFPYLILYYIILCFAPVRVHPSPGVLRMHGTRARMHLCMHVCMQRAVRLLLITTHSINRIATITINRLATITINIIAIIHHDCINIGDYGRERYYFIRLGEIIIHIIRGGGR